MLRSLWSNECVAIGYCHAWFHVGSCSMTLHSTAWGVTSLQTAAGGVVVNRTC
jgi:hypothetical protein